MDESEYETVPDSGESATLGGGRYVLEAPIGKGGMARVYRALDTLSGRQVALKQLRARAEGDSQQRSRELFEREFHTMAELAHPRIVAAIDYGVDAELPYYTMELLDGGDLLERSPLGWREACAVTRDICSALSLLHSRRLVYRDLSPRNVRCTSDGKAKLIDLGAMAKMGSAQAAVCTPAVASPEVVYRQELDGRSDLYALGATLYCTLVARSAYPARTFQQLIDLWQRPLLPPSELVPDIPPALDTLVMDLLQLDPALRPASAAEVSQRVCAIAGLENDEQLLCSQAYLSTPNLVGRERELERIGGMVRRAARDKRGAAVLVRGAPGMGRSRVLDACALSAKLAGLTVLRASAANAPAGSFGLAQVLAAQLLELSPDETLQAAQPHQRVLAAIVPELRAKLPSQSELPGPDLQAQAPSALRGFLLAFASQRPLLVAVDDVERFDPDSRALCALLAHKSHTHPLVFVAATSLEQKSEGDDARLLSQACTQLALAPLTLEHTHALLASIFGEVPNLSQLVRRTHALAAGNPQNAMRLAQHLLDRGVVRFSGGAWALPDGIDDGDLPSSMAETFAATIAALPADARALAQGFAQYADQRFTFDECLALSERQERLLVYRQLDQLVAASVLSTSLDGYALASAAWVAPLHGELDPELAVRLSKVFMARGDGIRAVGCLYRAGRNREGTELLVEHSRESHRRTSANTDVYVRFLATLPADWPQIFYRGLELVRELGLPAHDGYLIKQRMTGIMSQNDFCSEGLQAELAQQLARDAGLDLFAQLDPALPLAARLQQALGGAAARYAATPERERVLDPKTAIGMLARTVIAAIGNLSRSIDVHEWRQVPSVTALAGLSPSMMVVERLARGFEARVSGRFEDACEIYRETLALLADGNAGLDPTFAESVRAALPGIIGFTEAALSLPSSLRSADEVAKFPLFHGSALAIRMLDRLWQGDVVGADRIGRERELWRLEQARQQTSDILTVLWTLQAHAASDDLTHARHDLEAIERTAQKLRPWQPIAAWARGEYERIRGDHEAALTALDSALAQLPAATHQIWPCAAGARLKVLCELGRVEHARADGERYLAIAREHGLGYVASYIAMPLAVACARLGDADAAWAHARSAIDCFERLGARGLHVGLAHEAAAKVALALNDRAAFEQHAAHCKARYLAFPNPALAAKYQRLTRQAQRATQAQLEAAAIPPGESVLTRSQIESVLVTCASSEERLKVALRLLVTTARAERGYLYGFGEGGPALRASSHDVPPPAEIEASARRYLQYEVARDGETATATADGTEMSLSGMWTSGLQCYLPVLLNHRGPQGFMIGGLAVLMIDSRQPLRAIVESATQISQVIVDHGDLTAFVVG